MLRALKAAAIVALIGAVALIAPAIASPQSDATHQKAAVPQTHVAPDVPTRDNFTTLTYNHFGSPSAGQAVFDTWIRQTYNATTLLPQGITGQARATRLYKVKRIAIRVVLHTREGTTNDNATSSTVNSANIGNPRLFTISSPSITANSTPPQFCVAWTEVFYSIRWADDTLTSGKSFPSSSDLWNDNCYFTPEPPTTAG
jgi:hypothetical protein